jgi:hypothetical protein
VIWVIGAAAAAAIGVLVVTDDRDDRPGEVAPADAVPWTPDGVEFPLEDLGVPRSEPGLWVSVAGLTRALGVEGHPPLVVSTSLVYSGGPTAELQRCLFQAGSGGCAPEWTAAHPSVGITSSVDNTAADYDLWTWDNISPEAAYVTYVDRPEVRWQRPIAGVALFPDVAGDDEVVIAYDSEGVEVARVDAATLAAAERRLDGPPPPADISPAQSTQLSELTDISLEDCLIDHGAHIEQPGRVAVLPAGVDDVEAWSECVAAVKATVAQRLDEIDADGLGAQPAS